jgi:hypothetical protein
VGRPIPMKTPIKWKVPIRPIRPIRNVIRSLMKPIKPGTVIGIVIVGHISGRFFYDSIIINGPIDIISLRISGKCKKATKY